MSVIAERERDLVAQARAGDEQAFDELVGQNDRTITKLCARFFGEGTPDAEDAAQEARLRAWKSIGRFRENCSFGTWLFRVARSACLNLCEQRRRRPSGDWESLEDTAAVPSAEEQALPRAAAREWLDALRARLEERDWQIVVLTYQMKMSSEEVAHQLGMSATNVRQRLFRPIRPAIQTVRKELGDA